MAHDTLMISIRNRNLTFRNNNHDNDPTTTLLKVRNPIGEVGSSFIPKSVSELAIVIVSFTHQHVLLNKSANFCGRGKEKIVVVDGRKLPALPAKYLKLFGEAFKRQSFTDTISMEYLVENLVDDVS